jgi:hypothetical protein
VVFLALLTDLGSEDAAEAGAAGPVLFLVAALLFVIFAGISAVLLALGRPRREAR